jgi:predicted Zn-dependent protease
MVPAPARLRQRLKRAIAAIACLAVAVAAPAAQAQSLIRDTEIEEWLRSQADPVFAASGLNPADVKLLLIGDRDLNAFATRGQIIGINTGTLQDADTPNQLLGVLAHEAGHVSGGHAVRDDLNRAGMRPMLLTAGLGALTALLGAPGAGLLLMGNSTYFGTLGALGYSRSQEGAADQAGITALDKAGLSGRGLVEFFDKYRYQEVFSEAKRYEFFRSHPISSERVEALRRRVDEMPNADKEDSPEAKAQFAIMKAKLDGFMNPPQFTYVKYKETDTSYPARYARAIAYYRDGQPDRALTAIDALLQEQPENPYLWELKGQVLFEFARAPEAEAAHRRAVELKPEAPLLRLYYGQTLLALGTPEKTDEAIVQLKRSLMYEKDSAMAWRLLAQAYDAKNDPANARLASAEASFHQGDYQTAAIFAARARDLLTANTPEWRRASDIIGESQMVRRSSED